MKSRYYKIKNKDTAEFWSGYGSSFTKNGAEFKSLEDVGIAITAQLKMRHSSIKDWVNTAQVLEYDVLIVQNPNVLYAVGDTIKLAALYLTIRNDQDQQFLYGFKKLISGAKPLEIKHAAKIVPREYEEFRKTLKDLGYNSRSYRKIGPWIWFSEDAIGALIRLLPGVDKVVSLQPYCDEFNKLLISIAPDLDDDEIQSSH